MLKILILIKDLSRKRKMTNGKTKTRKLLHFLKRFSGCTFQYDLFFYSLLQEAQPKRPVETGELMQVYMCVHLVLILIQSLRKLKKKELKKKRLREEQKSQ